MSSNLLNLLQNRINWFDSSEFEPYVGSEFIHKKTFYNPLIFFNTTIYDISSILRMMLYYSTFVVFCLQKSNKYKAIELKEWDCYNGKKNE